MNVKTIGASSPHNLQQHSLVATLSSSAMAKSPCLAPNNQENGAVMDTRVRFIIEFVAGAAGGAVSRTAYVPYIIFIYICFVST